MQDKDNIKISQLSSTKKETVCAVVVTYNRKKLLLECLEALRKQTRPLDAIYIIDNASTDNTPKVLLENNYLPKVPPLNLNEPWETSFLISNLHKQKINSQLPINIHYVRINENTGGAGGFYEGVKRGYEKGYDWLWLMDDDVKADKKCLENLLKYKSKFNVIVPLRLSKEKDIREWPAIKYNLSNPFLIRNIREVSIYSKYKDLDKLPKIIEVQDFSFEGPLIHRSIIEKIGYPKKDLFIYGDDTDYSLKIRYKLKEKIIVIKEAKMFRTLEQKKSNDINWKTYYFLRNINYIHLKYGENIFVKIKPIGIFLGRIVKSLITFKLNSKKFKLSYYTLIDSWKKELPIRYKPGDKI